MNKEKRKAPAVRRQRKVQEYDIRLQGLRKLHGDITAMAGIYLTFALQLTLQHGSEHPGRIRDQQFLHDYHPNQLFVITIAHNRLNRQPKENNNIRQNQILSPIPSKYQSQLMQSCQLRLVFFLLFYCTLCRIYLINL